MGISTVLKMKCSISNPRDMWTPDRSQPVQTYPARPHPARLHPARTVVRGTVYFSIYRNAGCLNSFCGFDDDTNASETAGEQ